MRRPKSEAFLQHVSFVLDELPNLPARTRAIRGFKEVYYCASLIEAMGKSYTDASCECECRVCKKKNWKIFNEDRPVRVEAEEYHAWIKANWGKK